MTLKIPREMSLWKTCKKISRCNLVFNRKHSMNVKLKKIKCYKIGMSHKVSQIKKLKNHLCNEIKQIFTKRNNGNRHRFNTHNKEAKENISYYNNHKIIVRMMKKTLNTR